jgi:hypothetical protein
MEERVCTVCQVAYQADPKRLRHGRQTTCSRACSYQIRTRRVAVVLLACAWCGAEFTRRPGGVKAKHGAQYCSRPCHYAGRSAGLTKRVCTQPYVRKPIDPGVLSERGARTWETRRERGNDRHTEATKEKLREATTKHIATTLRAVSGIEDEVAKELTRRGVAFDRQVALRDPRTGRFGACVDFMIGGVAVEVNGSFWHTDPVVYPDGPTHLAQWRTGIAYARKRGLLFRLEIPLVEIWERAVSEDLANAVDRALHLIGAR